MPRIEPKIKEQGAPEPRRKPSECKSRYNIAVIEIPYQPYLPMCLSMIKV